VYYRVTGAPTNLTIEVSWTDTSGAQTNVAVNGVQAVGSHSVTPIFVNADAGTTITVQATAGVADLVYVSSSIAGA
jgi:hypothetical protein